MAGMIVREGERRELFASGAASAAAGCAWGCAEWRGRVTSALHTGH